MAIQAKKPNPIFVFLIIAAGIGLWIYDQKNPAGATKTPPAEDSAPIIVGGGPRQKNVSPGSKSAQTQGGYEVYPNCRLAPEKNNDGDSFRVQLPDGRAEIFRLYFVDTPESAFKTYARGEDNHQRIREQAGYFGISSEKAVEIGQQAKHFTLDLLAKSPFTLYTEWDSPFNDQRYHAFIEVKIDGKPRWLHEILVEKGLARLKTKPADLPDGTYSATHRKQLEAAKQAAMKAGTGAWAR